LKLTFEELERRLSAGLGEDESLEFKPHLFESQKGIKNPILKGVVALANSQGGNLVIGVEQRKGAWVICGTTHNEEDVKNWFSQIVYEYVEPDGLPFRVYPIISTEKNLRCVAIEVGEPRGRYFAVRYSGRSSKKEPSYYFPLRLGDSNRLVDFHSFVRNVFSNWVMGLSAVSEREIFPSYTLTEEREFDVEKFKMRLDELKSIKGIEEPETERIIRDELRNSLTDLPYDHVKRWTDDLRGTILELTNLLLKEFKTGNEELRKRIMDMLCIIAYRADKETLEKIRHDFLEIFERLYVDPEVKKSSDLIKLLQVLHCYEPDYIKKMIKDAIEQWSKEDFDSRYRDIEIDRYLWKDVNRLMELRSYILKSLATARKSKDMEKIERLEKLYDVIRSR
jgi:hypothetical protein